MFGANYFGRAYFGQAYNKFETLLFTVKPIMLAVLNLKSKIVALNLKPSVVAVNIKPKIVTRKDS